MIAQANRGSLMKRLVLPGGSNPVLSSNGWGAGDRWVWRWTDRIDRRFIENTRSL
jgi:hypothetical protein